jgi:ankyrin repeat protein
MESVRLLLAAKADDASKNECLMTAASCYRYDMARLLIEARADPYAPDRTGVNVVEIALRNGDLELAKLF